ncbi:carboxypeptidase-like regulatory domain-containing protein [Paludisphaera soli]|uniref:carboxypeptidase-like regulatory domain-containing protein n=1 Tax=Paludisphaera soli TaxID=2712865 RepID=UPI0013EBEEB5|nr:carboxypeptidase-like regulatory domain-containing protein [Paludisphaera soli]
MNARIRRPIGLASLLWIAVLAAGCGGGSEEDTVDARLAKLEALAPVSGVVTVGGKPLPGVVVTFIPEEWAPAHGETDEDGRYTLETAARPGAIPGKYKVALSYLVAADGRVLGLEPRGGFVPDPAVATAVEKLPPEYVSPEKTPLTAEIPPDGGSFDFAVDAQIEPTSPEPEAAAEPVAPAPE